MFPLPTSSATAAAASGSASQAVRSRLLTPPESSALLGEIQRMCSQAQSLIHHLQSKDPAARLPQQEAEALLAQCRRLADRSFLADVAPALTTGPIRSVAGTPAPPFNIRHQSTVRHRTAELDQLILKLRDQADSQLDSLCKSLQDNVQRARGEAKGLGTDCRLPSCDRAEALLQRIRQRPGETDLERCSIGKQVQSVSTHAMDVTRTLRMLQALSALRTGFEGSPPFSHEQHPSFYRKWLQAVDAVNREDWTRYASMEKPLYEERIRLMQASRPGWVPQLDLFKG